MVPHYLANPYSYTARLHWYLRSSTKYSNLAIRLQLGSNDGSAILKYDMISANK